MEIVLVVLLQFAVSSVVGSLLLSLKDGAWAIPNPDHAGKMSKCSGPCAQELYSTKIDSQAGANQSADLVGLVGSSSVSRAVGELAPKRPMGVSKQADEMSHIISSDECQRVNHLQANYPPESSNCFSMLWVWVGLAWFLLIMLLDLTFDLRVVQSTKRPGIRQVCASKALINFVVQGPFRIENLLQNLQMSPR